MLELLKHMDDKVYTPRTYIIADTDQISEDKVGFLLGSNLLIVTGSNFWKRP